MKKARGQLADSVSMRYVVVVLQGSESGGSGSPFNKKRPGDFAREFRKQLTARVLQYVLSNLTAAEIRIAKKLFKKC